MKKVIIILSIALLATQNICAMDSDDNKAFIAQFIGGEFELLETKLEAAGIRHVEAKNSIYESLATKIKSEKNKKLILKSEENKKLILIDYLDWTIQLCPNELVLVKQKPLIERGSLYQQVARAQAHIADFLQESENDKWNKIENLHSTLNSHNQSQKDKNKFLLNIHQKLLDQPELKTVDAKCGNLNIRLHRGIDEFEIQEVCSTPQKAFLAAAIIATAAAAISGLVYHNVWKPIKTRWQQHKAQQQQTTAKQPIAKAA